MCSWHNGWPCTCKKVFYKSRLWMTILYMVFCASFLIKYSVSIMQSVNIHVIKIVNKTCRCFIKILDLICTFSKLVFFFLNFSFFFNLSFKIFHSFFFSLVKQQTPPREAVGTRERLHLPLVFRICRSSLCATALHFLRHNYLVKWCVNLNPVTARPNDKVASGPPLAGMSAPIRNPHAKNRLAWK